MFKDKKTKWIFFTFVVLFTLHITPATYINANFLSQFFGTEWVSSIYIFASVATILTVFGLRDKLRRFGNYKVFISALMLETCALALLLFTDSSFVAFIAVATTFICHATSFICIDIFLERHTFDEHTGKVRGLYLTTINSAYIIGPFIASLLLSNGDFKNVYFFIFILMFPLMSLANELFKDFTDDSYDQIKIISGFKKIRKNADLYSTIMSDFILQFFYSWMVIYIPMFLYQEKNFSLSEVTLILSIALIPFILTQSIAGKLADTRYGEKEMMSIGFIVMSVATGMLSFVESSNISVWIAILFMSRIGASMVEVMTETHIFKRIDSGDINVISIFRILNPTACVAGALFGTLFLHIVSFNMMFLILSGVTLYGLRYSLAITDTK
jgi:MFS family permease